MNRYPLWKYIVVAIALAVGFIYTLPNFYGESPAVQISAGKPTVQVDAMTLKRVEDVLKSAKIPYELAQLDTRTVKVRFADTDTQLRAKTVLEEQLGSDYVVALNLLSRSPAWLAAIHAQPMYLGLDLRGGVHFLLQIDTKTTIDRAVERYASDVRALMRENRVQYSAVARRGQAVEVKFPDGVNRAKAKDLIAAKLDDLVVREEDRGGELYLVATLKPEALKRRQEMDLKQNLTTLRNRVNELGVAEPIIQQQGVDRIVVQLPGVQDTARAKQILGRTATLELRMADFTDSEIAAALAGQVPLGAELMRERNGQPVLVRKNVVLTGEYITDASAGFDEHGRPAVHMTLDSRGARIFQQLTRENIGKRMAILLIEKGQAEVVTAPVIQTEIPGGRVQITGMRSTEEANDIALLLRAGALAAPMEIIEERTVGPSLGSDNIRRGFYSTLVGFAGIVLFMVAYYRVFGVIASLALAVNVMLLVALLSMLQATLTLPGIAGIALTVGMAIDANVLIFERIREELRNGNTPQASIHAGYDRAWDTILDSNITTLIAGFFLFWLGSGPVRGFAVTLCLGILTSMFSAVTVSRAMVNLTYGRMKRIQKLSIG
ncbi:protein translocase subunit SecD [Thiobacter aerophilum]|uniref:Protein translocase subunit SecD n=1 Tax=Thiobacter aerophilum TaxID=3121275 RepID=A0ABV0EF21_9BURK